MSRDNLLSYLEQAGRIDAAEGLLAYKRYHQVMRAVADKYDFPLPNVVAVFCALSPNNDYMGNLRSMVSVLDGLRRGVPYDQIVVSTYKHCRDRAIKYALGHPYLATVKGLKITNFYHNVLTPEDNRWVTIDGHMVAAWKNKKLTMKEAIIRRRYDYFEIAEAVKRIAFERYLLPNQVQATIWFVRKRVYQIKYVAQLGLLGDQTDHWETIKDVDTIKPFNISAQPVHNQVPRVQGRRWLDGGLLQARVEQLSML